MFYVKKKCLLWFIFDILSLVNDLVEVSKSIFNKYYKINCG